MTNFADDSEIAGKIKNNDDSVYIEEITTHKSHIALYPLQIYKFAINRFVK